MFKGENPTYVILFKKQKQTKNHINVGLNSDIYRAISF